MSKFQSTLVELQGGAESDFVARFIANEMAIYDSRKEERMEMLKNKIAADFDSYVSMKLLCACLYVT